MRDLVRDILLAFAVTGIWSLLREARRERELQARQARLYCDDDGELLPITVVGSEDRTEN
jgi:hypothetical protein